MQNGTARKEQVPPPRPLVIDQTRSAPITKAQLQASRPAGQSAAIANRPGANANAANQARAGGLPSLNIGINRNVASEQAAPTQSIDAIAASAAIKAAPEVNNLGGGFGSARGLKRSAPDTGYVSIMYTWQHLTD